MEEKNVKIEHVPSARNQYVAVFIVNLFILICGMEGGWTIPIIMILTSDESPLPFGKITTNELSWFASLGTVGCFIGCMSCGFITSNFGRKRPLILMIIPQLICWLLYLYPNNVNYLYISQLLCGFTAGGSPVIALLFISEISNDANRGILASTQTLSASFGILLGFILGFNFDYYTTPKYMIILLILYAILFAFFPESPIVLVKENRIMEAKRSIKFYHNTCDDESERLYLEMCKLTSSLYEMDKFDGKSFDWSDFLVNPGRKALLIGIVLVSLYSLCGIGAITIYAGTIFEAAGSSIPISTSVIFIGIIQFLGAIIAMKLIEHAGRRFLYTVSTIGTALGMATLGVFMMLKSWEYNVESYNWISIISFSLTVFSTTLGIISLPFVIISEVMPESLKEIGTTMCFTLLFSIGFIVSKYFPFLTDIIGYHGTMFLFAGFSLFGTIFVLYLPETKGKSREQIIDMLR